MAFDATERLRAEEQARQAELHDELTQLPNRALFLDRLGHAWRVAGGKGVQDPGH